MNISLSSIDKSRFGITTAKMQLSGDEPVPDINAWCDANSVELLIARCRCDDIALVQKLEADGFFLTDTLVYYRNKELTQSADVLKEGYSTRFATAADAATVGALAEVTFAGYTGHYHADPRLASADCDAVYSSWAASSCASTAVADQVILIEHGGKTVAFATVKKVESYMMEGVLFGVSPEHQGRSLYNALMLLAQNWAMNHNFKQMIVSTQVTNLAVQKVWCRQRFEPFKSYYTFHKWFAKPAR
ncbi:GNAT family N-acetyltransferase [Massilia sp. TWP1-3-3]|uniref:GNAT family N-acetyltransferase n=1 Tax=Massilia sp. TWP1-3-3 TaxID=2804573 RepID=UPI003CE8698B